MSHLDWCTLIRTTVSKVCERIEFDSDDVPICCMELCPHFSGKYCNLTGNEPEQTCRPVVTRLVRAIMVLDAIMVPDHESGSLS